MKKRESALGCEGSSQRVRWRRRGVRGWGRGRRESRQQERLREGGEEEEVVCVRARTWRGDVTKVTRCRGMREGVERGTLSHSLNESDLLKLSAYLDRVTHACGNTPVGLRWPRY